MQTFVVKLASGIAAFVAAMCLSINHLSKGEEVSEAEQVIDFAKDVAASSKLGLRMTMTIVPIFGLVIAIYVFAKKFILTEEKVQEIADQLKK